MNMYKRGKGASVYRSSGFRNYGCLMGLFLLPLQLLLFTLVQIIQNFCNKNNKGLVKIREDFDSTLSSTLCIYYHFCD